MSAGATVVASADRVPVPSSVAPGVAVGDTPDGGGAVVVDAPPGGVGSTMLKPGKTWSPGDGSMPVKGPCSATGCQFGSLGRQDR